MLAVASSDALLLYDFSAHARVSLFGFDVEGDARASVALSTSIAKPTRATAIGRQARPSPARVVDDDNDDDDDGDDGDDDAAGDEESSSSIGEIG
jgi:erythromycin esterase-like protein